MDNKIDESPLINKATTSDSIIRAPHHFSRTEAEWDNFELNVKLNSDDEALKTQDTEESKKKNDNSGIGGGPTPPKRSFMHKLFLASRYIAFFLSFNMAVGEIVILCYSELLKLEIIEFALHIYLLLISIMIMFNEIGWFKFILTSEILRNWISRGALYAFIGVIGLNDIEVKLGAEDMDVLHEFAYFYLVGVSWAMIGSGALYVLLGVLCLQRLHDELEEDHRDKLLRHQLLVEEAANRKRMEWTDV